ncbi:MAG: TolC family protein [Oligoflexia bacterium]|nr:TolC family protein [Oligoflexia bacterium]
MISPLLLLVALQGSTAAASVPVLNLEHYLGQVREKNLAVTASLQASEGAKARSGEGALLLAPTFFATAQTANDGKPTLNPALQGNRTLNTAGSIGVSQQTSFGLTAKLSYNASFTDIQGSQMIPAGGYHESRPALELSQPLWRNWMGRETRATQELLGAQALATSYSESFKARLSVADAESAYWRLVLAREAIEVQKASLARAAKIRDWNKRRVELHLADRTDLLQAEAGLQVRSLELQSARDEERAAAFAFNTALGSEASEVSERLEALEAKQVLALPAPERAEFRDDIQAARQQSRLADAGARIGTEKNRPSVELFASLALNGRNSGLGSALSDSLGTQYSTTALGVRVAAPLDFAALSANREGYRLERLAAEQAVTRKVYEQERDWSDLVASLADAKRRLGLFLKMEQVQESKLMAERDRHDRGRSTTYQVLLFEQDFAQAQLGRIQAEAVILRLLARMKTFSASPLGASRGDS